MLLVFLFAAVSFILSLILTPIWRTAALNWGLVDHPDQGRKLHHFAIARAGGPAILSAYVLTFGAMFLVPPGVHFPLALRIAPAVLMVFLTGLADDVWNIQPWQKFLGQIAASMLAYAGGVHLAWRGHELPGWVGFPATVFWLVLCSNAVNLIDGLDGLAAGVGLFATLTTLVAALLQNNLDLALAVAPLAGCLLGFLRYNFNPATVFLGDSGSLLIGFFLGCCSVIWSEKAATILGMTAPGLALSIPLLDTLLAVARRFLRGKPIFGADRGHIHHRLLDRGLTPRRAALLIYVICAVGAVLSLLMMDRRLEGIVVVLFCLAAWFGVQHLAYPEFSLLSQMLKGGEFTRLLNSHVELRAVEGRMAKASTIEECWVVVQEAGRGFGFDSIEMEMDGRRFQYRSSGIQRSWEMRVPICEFNHLTLRRSFGVEAEHEAVAAFADLMRKTLEGKAAEWNTNEVPQCIELGG